MSFINNPKTSKNVFYDPDLKFYHRGDGDIGIWNEQKGWKKGLDLLTDGLVLDLGAHIGLFPLYLKRNYHGKTNQIICVEPDPNNLRVLERNLVEGSRIIEKAVGVGDTNFLYLGKTYPAANSMREVRGRDKIEVDMVSFDSLLAMEPEFIKVDIEGAEYLLCWENLPDSVKTIVFEFHFFKNGDDQRMEDIRSALADQGFEEIKSPKVNNFSKVSFGTFHR